MARVSFDDAGKQTVEQMISHINGEMQSALQRLNTLADQLNQNPNFQGKWADQYRGNVHPAIKKNTKQMHDSTNHVSTQLKQIGAHIYEAAGNA